MNTRLCLMRIAVWLFIAGSALAAKAAQTQFASDSPARKPIARNAQIAPAFTPAQAQIDYADAKWIVWTTYETLDRDFKKRVQTRRTRYFRQKLDSPDAPQVFEMAAVYSRPVYAVLDDGTVLLSYGHELVWAFPDGKDKQEYLKYEGHDLKVVGGFRDGLLVQSDRHPEAAPVYFVPFENRGLRFDRRFLVTDEAGFKPTSRPCFARGGDWLAYGQFLTNLRTRERRKVPDLHANAMPTACDGETLIFWGQTQVAVALPGGRQTPMHLSDPAGNIRFVFAVKHGIGYFFDYDTTRRQERVLRAFRVSEKPSISKGLLTVQVRNPLDGASPILDFAKIPHLKTDEALIVWDGAKWVTIPWLDDIDGSKGE
ncbi:MAG: hypothetical protein ACM3U2_10475 [Deltaproteobacteria bacterium]